MDPLFNAFVPGCRKNGRFSSINVTRANISRAVAPLLARTAIVFSGLNNANQSRYATDEIDLPDCLQASTILNLLSLKCLNIFS
jgi:hypothetical protein